MAQESAVRCTVIFRGRVQGVGFRFRTTDVATRYPITGYVMNLTDGTVRMVGEGKKADVSSLIRSVLEEMHGLIADHTEEWGSATGEFPSFSVRYEGR